MQLTCRAFGNNEKMPKRYSGEGQNISPPLVWSDVPAGCQEFALICEDPDAPGGKDHPFVHWILYNILSSVTALPEGIPAQSRTDAPVRADQGKNSFDKIGYGGPMPPAGHGIHHYVFRLYALNTRLGLPPGATKAELLRAMQGHILAEAQLVGTYTRGAAEEAA